jgi:hypothetical protein
MTTLLRFEKLFCLERAMFSLLMAGEIILSTLIVLSIDTDLIDIFVLCRSHKDFASLSDQDAIAELERVETAFDRILGVQPRLFRFPYGNFDDRLLGILKQRGYTGGSLYSP